MEETSSYESAIPDDVCRRYQFFESGSAAKLAEALCPDEWADVLEVLSEFTLSSRLLLSPGGNRGPIPTLIDGMFDDRGWQEARVDVETRTYLFPGHSTAHSAEENPELCEDFLRSRSYQLGYAVDNFKGSVALDVEWNPKDGNLDRDFAAYRAWHERGIISLAVLVTRAHESTKALARRVWADFVEERPDLADCKQPVDYSTTTTANFEKAVQRVKRGDLGTCPILVVGIGERAWDGQPWDGMKWKWDKEARKLVLAPAFGLDAEEAAEE